MGGGGWREWRVKPVLRSRREELILRKLREIFLAVQEGGDRVVEGGG